MLGFGALGQLALGEPGGIRQDLIRRALGTGDPGDDRRRRRAYEVRRDLIRRKAKREWYQRAAEWRRQQEARRARANEIRRRRAEEARLAAIAEAKRLEAERQRLLAEALLLVHDAAREAELRRHIADIEAQLHAIQMQILEDDIITVLLLTA